MKKLICALVLLVMLVPVAAMAGGMQQQPPTEVPPTTLTTEDDLNKASHRVGDDMNDVRYQRHWNDNDIQASYTASYFLTGALDKVVANYHRDCHCMVVFRPNGVISDGDSHIQDNCTASHTFPLEPLPYETDNKPENSVMDVADDYEWAQTEGDFSAFLKVLEQAYNSTDVTNFNQGEEARLVKYEKDSRFLVSFKNKENKAQKKFVHFGPIVYKPGSDSMLRVYGNKYKNILSWADYDVKTGELDHYGMFSADGRMETVYSAKNVLISTEIWTDDGGYWQYKKNDWLYSANGNPDDGDFETPSAEVLEMITLSPRKATFTVDGSKGTPKVSGSVSAETEVTMLDSHRTEFVMTTTDSDNLKEPITLLLPYGAGQNRAIAEQFTYTVVHEPEDKPKETYSTEPTNASQIKMTFTEDGVELTNVKSFSPFTVEWGPKQASTVGMDSLPSTGDSSNLLAYACLLMVSAAALYMLGKRRAHQ